MIFLQVAAKDLRSELRTKESLNASLSFAVVILLLPITPSDGWKPSEAGNPTWRILALLSVSVGAPYVLLATTSPLLQRWLTSAQPGGDVSRLFAISNLGSFVGLLSYPFVFERWLSSLEQTRLWSVGFVVYAALFGMCAFCAWRKSSGPDQQPPSTGSAEHRGGPAGLWILYAALGSVLLLATTNQITQWSAVVPFLWVAPLSL
ncbi:MAG: hypothetical protein B7X34_07175, partial [Acidobacteriia bacterium 12-62-4]